MSWEKPDAQIIEEWDVIGKKHWCLPCSSTLPPGTFCWWLEETVHLHRWIFYLIQLCYLRWLFPPFPSPFLRKLLTYIIPTTHPLYTPQHVSDLLQNFSCLDVFMRLIYKFLMDEICYKITRTWKIDKSFEIKYE